MSFIEAKCPNCTSILPVDSAKEAWICGYCGTPFIVEKAVNNYNIEKASINAETVNIYNSNGSDFVIRGGVLEKYNGASVDVIIPDIVVIIGKKAFENCRAIKSIKIPETVAEIEDSAFSGCLSLERINVPDGVKKINSYTFSKCTNLQEVILPLSLESIESDAFFSCCNLESIIIPNSVKKLGDSVFKGCSRLDQINIPNQVTYIGNYAFSDCTNLMEIKIPDSVIEIGNNAFSDCINLMEIKISDSVIEIGSNAFRGCDKLKSVFVPNKNTHIYGQFLTTETCSYSDIHSSRTTNDYKKQIKIFSICKERKDKGKCIYCGNNMSLLSGKCKKCEKTKDCFYAI